MGPYRAEEIKQSVAAAPACAHGDLRRNARQRDIVATGIAMLPTGGVMMAVEYMKSYAVGPAVIERVVWEPQRRRT